MVTVRGNLLRALPLVVFAGIVADSGCAQHRVLVGIHSPDALGRILAIRRIAEEDDREAIPLLVDRLDDQDSGVRFYAIVALDRMTGERFGYDYAQSAAERGLAVEKWRAFAMRGGHVERIGAEPTAAPGPALSQSPAPEVERTTPDG